MHTVPTGRYSETVEMWDGPTVCTCGRSLTTPPYSVGWRMCSCAGGRGHRIRACQTCWAEYHDPPHVETARGIGAGDYFTG